MNDRCATINKESFKAKRTVKITVNRTGKRTANRTVFARRAVN